MTVKTTTDREGLRRGDGSRQGRHYVLDGARYLSVTNILNAWPKDALMWWAAGMTASEAMRRVPELLDLVDGKDAADIEHLIADIEAAAKRKTNAPGLPLWKDLRKAHKTTSRKAADRGGECHELIERHLLGDDVESDNPYFAQFLDFCSAHAPEWEAAEAIVANRTYGYAGTLDAVATLDAGQTRDGFILDFKTRDDTRVFDNMAVQVAAMAHCDAMADPANFGKLLDWEPPKRGAILTLTPSQWRLTEVDVSDRMFSVFAGVMHVRHLQLDGDHEVAQLGNAGVGST